MLTVEKFHRYLIVCCAGLFSVLCGCQGIPSGVTSSTPPPATGLTSINHIIFMAQENRSLDTYFGQLQAYWQANGYPQASQQPPFDGLPANASNPSYDGTSTVPAYHVAT